MKTLVLRLAGPMQSWGVHSRYTHRDTWEYPTFSGVVGLLSAALGRDRGSDCSDLTGLDMVVRVDRPGRIITDFHTAEVDKGKTAEVDKGKTALSTRDYISDARFTVALTGAGAVVDMLAGALRRPVFQLALGRRSCVPAEPVFLGVVDTGDTDAALSEFPTDDTPTAIVRTVVGGQPEKEASDSFVVWDEPYATRGRWQYRPRTVVVERCRPNRPATLVEFDPFDLSDN